MDWGIVFDIAQKAGAAGGLIFALLWKLEHDERREIAKLLREDQEKDTAERNALLERALKAFEDTRMTLKDLERLFLSSGPGR